VTFAASPAAVRASAAAFAAVARAFAAAASTAARRLDTTSMTLTLAANSPGEPLDSIAPNDPNGADRASAETRCLIWPRKAVAARAVRSARACASSACAVRVASSRCAAAYRPETCSSRALTACSSVAACADVRGGGSAGAARPLEAPRPTTSAATPATERDLSNAHVGLGTDTEAALPVFHSADRVS
jgi:hypothetical protein